MLFYTEFDAPLKKMTILTFFGSKEELKNVIANCSQYDYAIIMEYTPVGSSQVADLLWKIIDIVDSAFGYIDECAFKDIVINHRRWIEDSAWVGQL